MELLGIRFVSVSDEGEALARCLDDLGLRRRHFAEFTSEVGAASFKGAIFPGGSSWIEVWPVGEGMPPGIMLQLVVDDADAFAAHARRHGLSPQGPVDAHGEHIYFLEAPSGLSMSFQSALPAGEANEAQE
jgi:hypothetical protein